MRRLLAVAGLIVSAHLSSAQGDPETPPVRDVWILQMQNPRREYAVRLGALQTVTLQDYDVKREGKIQRVVEMTIETAGGNQAKFFWEDTPKDSVKLPNELEEKRREVEKAVKELTGVQRTEETPERVQKDYPETTHSAWAEFKITSEADVLHLHKQLMQLWTGKKRDQ